MGDVIRLRLFADRGPFAFDNQLRLYMSLAEYIDLWPFTSGSKLASLQAKSRHHDGFLHPGVPGALLEAQGIVKATVVKTICTLL